MSLHLLIVEDSATDAELLRRALDLAVELDQDGRYVGDLRSAREALATERFDCILLDLALPDAEGFDGLVELRSAEEDVPVIVLTGAGEQGVGSRAVHLGAQDYLNKNWISPEVIERSIRYAVERHRQQSALRAANTELDRFAAAVAHDLKTPIAVIYGFASLLESRADELDETMAECVDKIVHGAKRADAMITDLLDYGRKLTTGDAKGSVDLAAVVDWACDALAGDIDDAHATLRVGPLPEVWGNEAALRQVLLCLVDNALKYRGADSPLIDVRADRAPDGWAISVSDNGIGIEPQMRTAVLQPGVRLAPEGVAGTGLGLASCATIVRQHSGTIAITDSDLGGTNVGFTLPDPVDQPESGRAK